MLANYECDLHGHTNRSDGNDSPVEYIRHAVHRGVKILAITQDDAMKARFNQSVTVIKAEDGSKVIY